MKTDDDEGVTPAPAGYVWMCMACGKRSRTRYGLGKGDAIDSGWDESCMLNCALVTEEEAR